MNLFHKARDFLGFGPKLRNKPGGMAWIRQRSGPDVGDAVIAGRVVRTVRYADGFWDIDPPQQWVCKLAHLNVGSGTTHWPGQHMLTVGVSDSLLEPMKDPPHDAEDESKEWYPPVPKHLIPLPVVEMGEQARERG